MLLNNKTKSQICAKFDISIDSYDEMMEKELLEKETKKGKKVDKSKIAKVLNIVDNVLELRYYEILNLILKVKFSEIPSSH